MDAGKWSTLLEYKSEGKETISSKHLAEVCKMFCYGSELPDADLVAACDSLVEKIPNVKAIASGVVSGNESEMECLRALLLKYQASSSSAPVSSALSSLMAEDLGEDDEDEDASSGDEDEEPKESVLQPVMRGVIEISGGKLVWSGKWAISKELFGQGEKSKFKYSFSGDLPKSASVQNPPSGKYSGYFIVKGDDGSKSKVEEKKSALKFEKSEGSIFSVEGDGKNIYGEFTLSGIYDSKSGKLSVVKSYKPVEGADFEDDEGDDEIEEEDPYDVAQELADLQADAAEDIDMLKKRMREKQSSEKQQKKTKSS